MSEAQLRKVEAERDRLANELETLREAMSTKAACEELIKYVEATNEPLAFENRKDNPWLQARSSGGCCTIQ